eukprot:scaffold290_cov138-Skeletonema_menzelii.AAC.6
MSAEDDMAKDLTLKQLQGIQAGNKDRFESLDWRGVEEDTLVKLFPYNDRYGKLHPPITYLSSAEGVRTWRKIGKSDQQHEIQRAEQQQEAEAKSRSRRLRRSREAVSDDAGRTNEMQQQYASPPPKVTTVKKRRADGEGCRSGGDNEVDRLIPGERGASSPLLSFELTGLSGGEEEEAITNERYINSTNCRGISIRTIEQTRIDEKDKVTDGFSHLVGNVFRFKASYLSNHQCVWPYGRDVAGFVVNANAKNDIEGNPVYSWKCIEVDDYFDDNSNRIVCAFSHRDCSGTRDAEKK